jgi:hypothetical protein
MRAAMPPDGRLFAIDPFPPNRFRLSVQHAIFRREISRVANGVVTHLRQFSHEACVGWSQPIDLLFLDGDHSFEGMSRDFREWSRHVRPGGTIGVHTSQPSPAKPVPTTCGPYRLVREVIAHDAGFVIEQTVDSITVVRKR